MHSFARICGSLVAVVGAGLAMPSSQSLAAETSCAMRENLAGNPGLSWSDLRAACTAEQEAYEENNPLGFHWFINAGNGFAGFPYILQKVLPDLAPEIWGPPAENFARFGLLAGPNDSGRPLPQGLGITSTAGRPVDANGEAVGEIDFAKPGLHVVTLACGACHAGQVRTDSGVKIFDGAPNTQIDVRKWRQAYGLTVQNYLGTPEKIAATARKVAQIIKDKPVGFFYPKDYFDRPGFVNFSPAVETSQRAAVTANLAGILATFSCGTAERAIGQTLQLGTSYGNWNGPGLSGFSTGQQDGSGDLIFQLLVANAMPTGECQPGADGKLKRDFDPEAFAGAAHPEIPPFATITDIPSVWNQQARDLAQWDGSVKMAFWRNIAAQLPIVGDPGKIDLLNTGIVANYLHGLPPSPYPFEVDMASAVRGEALFKENCTACHKPHNNVVYQSRDIGTDMNRAQVLNEPALDLFLKGFSASCHDATFKYTTPDGKLVQPCQMSGDDVITGRVAPANQGYVTSVLDGAWARAPYLHNGAVPTLYHLLVPDERPVTFLRGAIDYDQHNLGFAWQPEKIGLLADGAPTLMLYDTRRDSHSNAGHDRNIVVDGKMRRLDWSGPQYSEQVRDLIEYLKTQ